MKALYFNTFHKEYRNRALIFLALITVFVILVANSLINYLRQEVVTAMGIQDIAQQSLFIFYYVITSWSTLVAIFIGVGTIKSDMDTGALIQLMSFPISRTQYYLTRLSGAFSIVFLYYVLSVVLAMVMFSLSSGKFVFDFSIFGALLFTGLDIFFVILLSSFVAVYWGTLKSFVGVLFILFVMSASSYTWSDLEFSNLYKDFGFFQSIKFAVYWLLPRLKNINEISSAILIGKDFPKSWVSDTIHYIGATILWSTIFIKIFNKRDL